jgi:hypothetical protein
VIANWTLNGITAMLPPEATSTMDFRLSTMALSSRASVARHRDPVRYRSRPSQHATDLVTDFATIPASCPAVAAPLASGRRSSPRRSRCRWRCSSRRVCSSRACATSVE